MADNGVRIWVVGADWLGDVIFATPVLRSLKKHYPDSFLAFSTSRQCAEILKGNPHVDEIVTYEEGTFLGGLLRHRRLGQTIRSLRIDVALFLHGSATRAFVAWAAGVRRRIGYASAKRRRLLTDPVFQKDGLLHRADFFLNTLGPLGIGRGENTVEIFVTQEGRDAFETLRQRSLLKDGRSYAVVHPGGNWDLKRWPIEYFAEVVRYVEEKGICAVICGTAAEQALAERLLGSAVKGNIVSLCGQTSLQVLAALIEKSLFMVSNDSGPLHLAAGLGTPLIGIFGPTAISRTGPLSRAPMRLIQRDVGCELPCYFESCHHRVCMEQLKPAEVIRAVDEILFEYEADRLRAR